MKGNKNCSFKTGQRVRVLFSGEEGVIADFYDPETALVDLNGDEIPIFLEHLEQVAPPAGKAAEKPKPDQPKILPKSGGENQTKAAGANGQTPTPTGTPKPDFGMNLLLQPVYDANAEIDHFLVFLHNNTGKTVAFDYKMSLLEREVFSFSRRLGERECLMLNALEFDQLNDSPALHFVLQLPQPKADDEPRFEKTLRPKARMLRKPPQPQPGLEQAAYTLPICSRWQQKAQPRSNPKAATNAVPSKLQQLLKQLEMDGTETEVQLNINFRITDLHIEALRSDHRRLTNRQILEFQLLHFEKQLTQAIEKREANMLAVHGFGKGKLRSELIKVMRQYPQVKRFEHNPRYGFGATEIIFEY